MLHHFPFVILPFIIHKPQKWPSNKPNILNTHYLSSYSFPDSPQPSANSNQKPRTEIPNS